MMNNCVQLLEKAENLKKELTHPRRNGLNGDGEATSNRAALQDLYRHILITNLEYALDKKIEQELWNIVFKNHITTLQQQTKDKANPKRTEVQNQLTVFLEASSGFYAILLQDLCSTFKINLPCRVRPSKLALLKDSDNIKQSSITQPERPSCQYMCQHCLVHLGDIARYRNQNGQAESHYRHAAHLVPSNGQPYNQLAILASVGGDVLSTAFYYCRSLAVKYPFPGSGTNLKRQLAKIADGYGAREESRHQKISTSELIKFYLRFHACIYLRKNDTKLEGMVKRLLEYMRAHLRIGSLSKKQLVQMAFVNLFSLNHLSQGGDNQEQGGKPESSVQENGMDGENGASWNILVSFNVRMLGALLTCIPSYSDDSEDLEHPALPATKLLLDWLCENSSLLRSENVAVYGSIWQRLAKVLNALGNQDKANNMENQPLPEDLEVRGFVGLRHSLAKLDFVAGYDSGVSEEMQHPCRCFRLYQLGLVIGHVSNGLLTTYEQSDGTVFSCPLPDEEPSENEEEEQTVLEKTESVEPPKSYDLNRPPRLVKETGTTTSILMSGERSSTGKNGNAESIKERVRVVKPGTENVSDSKLKSIQEEESYHHDKARSSTTSSLDSTRSSPSIADPPTHPHKPTHHVTFATMPTRHSPDNASNYRRRSPSPDFQSQRNMPSPDADYPMVFPQYPLDPRAYPQVQGVISHGPIHPLQPTHIPIGVYQRNYPFPGQVVQAPHHVPYPVHGMPPHAPTAGVALRSTQLHCGPNPAELPKPLFLSQRMSYPPEAVAFPNRTMAESVVMGGNMNEPGNMYQSGSSSSLARLAQLQQQQQMAQLNNQAMMHKLQQVRPVIPASLGLAARFPTVPGMRFPSNLQQMQDSMVPGRNSDPHMETFLNQQKKAALQQQQQQRGSGYSYPNTNLSATPGLENPNVQALAQQVMTFNQNQAANAQEFSSVGGYPFGQVPRSMFPMGRPGQPHASSPAGSNSTSSTSSPTPGSLGVVTSNTSPQAGSLPNQRAPPGGPTARYTDNFNGQAVNPILISQMIAAQQQKQGQQQQAFAKSPTQQKPSALFGHERGADMFRTTSEAANIPSGRSGSMLPTEIFGVSPNSAGMAAFGVGSIGQSPSSPNDPFPPYPLSQERQHIYDESLEMLEGRSTNVSSMQHQRAPVVSANDLVSKAPTKQREQRKQFSDLLSKDEDESYKLFPDTDPSWSLGRGSRNDNSLGLANLGSIGSERAMAQQSQPGRYLWGANTQGSPAPNRIQQPGAQNRDPRFAGRDYQSFWSAPMMPSGPSALEQLIRQQQEHAGQDKTPP